MVDKEIIKPSWLKYLLEKKFIDEPFTVTDILNAVDFNIMHLMYMLYIMYSHDRFINSTDIYMNRKKFINMIHKHDNADSMWADHELLTIEFELNKKV